MKKILFCFFVIAFCHEIQAQADYKVVFDLTSGDTLDHKSVMRWVTGIANGNPDAKMEVVMYGQGVHMVKQGGSPVEEAVKKALLNKNISFKVCGIALKNQGVEKTQLLPGVEVVDDGIYQIIKRQREGWGYIKAVH